MASFTYETIKKQYDEFEHPLAQVIVNGKNIADNKYSYQIADIEVEMTSGFEAAIATFWIYGCYDRQQSAFRYDEVKRYILMGSSVFINLGYGSVVREIFRGFIAKVNFSFKKGGMPGIEVTAMDVKGIMMSGSYSKQLKASYFSDGVKEILQQTAYVKLQSNEIITKLDIADTPDKPAVPAADALTSAIPGADAVAGALTGGDAVTGVLTEVGNLTSAIPGADAVTGALSDIGNLTSAIPGADAVTGALTGALSGAIPGADAVTGALTGALSGAIPGAGAVPGLAAVAGLAGGEATAKSIEMVAESDYEFVVKVAKKFNYEFFTHTRPGMLAS